jgi:hypothetical protein
VLEAGRPARSILGPTRKSIDKRVMALTTFDCIVIGVRPGGYVAAVRAAQMG